MNEKLIKRMKETFINYAEKSEYNRIHDCVVDILNRQSSFEQLKKIFMKLPTSIIADAMQWGFSDTCVGNNTYEWIQEHKEIILDILNEEIFYNFVIKNTELGYICFSLTYEHPLQYIETLTEELNKLNFKGELIFDGLASNGDELNRFVLMAFDGTNFERKNAKIVEKFTIKNEWDEESKDFIRFKFEIKELRKECNKFYMKNVNLLKSTIIGSSCLFSIQDGTFE
jgi:hypothetical protein